MNRAVSTALLVLACVAALSLAQIPCQDSLQIYSQCVARQIQSRNCVPGVWCDACTPQFTEYANCTCVTSISKVYPECVPQCIPYFVCYAEQQMDHTHDCTAVFNAFQNCIHGEEVPKPF